MVRNLHSKTRRDIMREILRKYHNTGKYAKINEHLANKIISRIFQLKIEQLYNNGYVRIGHGFGDIIITTFEVKADNITNYTIDWFQTNKLWETNIEAKRNKTLVRDLTATNPVKFKWTNKGKIKNLCYFSFRPSRSLKIQVYKDSIRNKPIMFLQ